MNGKRVCTYLVAGAVHLSMVFGTMAPYTEPACLAEDQGDEASRSSALSESRPLLET